jgi:Na+/melibiose symporter-like transporter
VNPRKRAAYSAGKEMLSLVTGMVMTLILGSTMDFFEAKNNLEGGFIFAAIAIFIFCACDFICLMLIKNDIRTKEEKHNIVPVRKVLCHTLGNRNFRSVVILTILWDVARYTTIGFLGTYRLGELAYTVTAVQIINLVGHVGRFVVSKPFGRFSDKYTFARGIELALILAAVGFGAVIFTSPGSRLLIIVYTLFYSMSAAGTNANLLNITYSYVDEKYFVQASAIKNSIGGIFGFGASLIGSRILSGIQANGNQIFGFTIYGQQILAMISFVLLIISILYTHFVIAKQKVMLQ